MSVVLTLATYVVLVVIVVYAGRWWRRYRARSLAGKLWKIMEATEISQIPKLSRDFADFMRSVHGVDLAKMSFREHVLYISNNLHSLWKSGAELYFQEGISAHGKLYLAVPAAASLAELVRSRYSSEWMSRNESSLPALRIDLGDGKTCCCPAFNAVWLQMPFKIKYHRPIRQMLQPFEDPEKLRKDADSMAQENSGAHND